jgi:hypothetical protein
MEAYEIYSAYFETVKQNFGFMLMYKLLLTMIIFYVSKFGFVRKGAIVVGQKFIEYKIMFFYVIGLVLCSMGMIFPYVDRIGLYFLMFEMPFWGGVVRANEMSIPYKIFCCIFVLYLYIMNLLFDGQCIFPYVSIWGVST